MNIHLNPVTPVGTIAKSHPELLPLFDRMKIDYCCRGHEPLHEACRHAGVDLLALADAVAEEIESPPASDDEPTTMTQWCDHIEAAHHALARAVFDRLGVLMPRILGAHGARHPRFVELDGVLSGLREEMLDHMIREERVLFPWLRRLEQPGAIHFGPPWSVQRPIDCMKHDHDSVSVALTRVRALTDEYTPPPDACGSVRALFETLRDFEADTRRHIHKENNILFPAGMEAEARMGREVRRHAPTACSHAATPASADANARGK
ncbi:MAG: DUF542 domain-containing protein [Planctomycetes bacterium]|nr:DUF542 domain-containing protein [Planctomycetota bacterium]